MGRERQGEDPKSSLPVDGSDTACYNVSMAQSRTTARTRTDARRQRQREQSAALAAGFSVLTIFLVATLTFLILLNLPGTPVRNFWLLLTVNGQVSPNSQLYRDLFAQIERQEALFVTPFCLLIGGLALGRLMPKRIPRLRLLRTAGIVTVGVVLACILFRWGLILYGQQGHLRAGELDTQVALTQTACSLGWIIAYLIGTWVGVLWRDAGHRNDADQPPAPTFSALSR